MGRSCGAGFMMPWCSQSQAAGVGTRGREVGGAPRFSLTPLS
ncbi:hypothetical protein BIWAKO_01446 [Bosea sp. BIWAKO-01]|nr:hypothetical protein BIWAKO_01446 [Bosea sp. BIWAKO-01]